MRSAPLMTSLLVVSLLGSGCVATGKVAGSAGPVEWEVVDAGRMDSVDGARTRWSFAIVLRNTGSTSIQFERIDRSSRIQMYEIVGGIGQTDYKARLEAGQELRYHVNSDWGWLQHSGPQFGGVSSAGSLTEEYRFIGKDSGGNGIAVPVRVMLDRSFGRASRQPARPEPPALPAKAVGAQDLASLAGRWTGYYRNPNFAVPLDAVIRADGSVEFEENDPVTNRFRGQLSARDGKLVYSGRDVGDFSYHEAAGRRVLVSHLTYRTGGGSGQGPLWLERVGDAPGSVAAPAPAAPARAAGLPAPASLPPAIQGAYETWRTDQTYRPYKAFAWDRGGSGAWGRSWSLGSVESAAARAMDECRKRGAACELHAVNDTVLADVPPERRAFLMLGGSYLHYNGALAVERDGRVERSPAMAILRWGLDEVTGSWSSDEAGISGTIKGGGPRSNPASVWLTMANPCRLELAGVVTLGEDGKTLEMSYAGSSCDGLPMRATFTGTRP